ncbi:MAG: riboflavin synthase [Rhodospirillaceae bacterium]|nr:riboflavin synthase [Rhodospirillaceae bacterium]MBT6883324.1 riboflavin synthase [Rhodospirillaceae bacterium]MBT7250555.1 riboflavin synthase [Rhodospirillaceae bacterium]
MFTGIVTDIGNVRAIAADGDTRLEITTTFDTSAIAIGASICCSGACLTVIDKGSEWFAAMVSAETLSKTTLSDWQVGTPVNLERALRMGDELGGHIVSGHVDGVGTLDASETEGDSTRMIFEAPSDLIRFIAPKGSITIDGVSLTVNDVTDNTFGINVIPHTQEATTLGALSVGGTVNLEIDMLARYVARLQDTST